MDHEWPDDNEKHMWGPWLQQNRTDAKGGATMYRSCIHPDCPVFEARAAARA